MYLLFVFPRERNQIARFQFSFGVRGNHYRRQPSRGFPLRLHLMLNDALETLPFVLELAWRHVVQFANRHSHFAQPDGFQIIPRE